MRVILKHHMWAINIHPYLQINSLTGSIRATRTQQGILIQVNLKAQTVLECVRCLNNFQQSLNVAFTELYAFSQRYVTDSGLLMPETAVIDLSPVLREYILLEIPISPLCFPS